MAVNFEKLNFNNICRTCMLEGTLTPIFSDDEALKLSQKIIACAAVQIEKNDGFPSNICGTCIEQVNQAYDFKKKCEEVDAFFHKHVEYKCEPDFIAVSPVDLKPEIIFEEVEESSVKGDVENFGSSYESCEDSKPEDDSQIEDEFNAHLCCKKCNISFLTKKSFRKHKSTHRLVQRTPCEICKKEVSVNYLQRHIQVHKLGKTFSCHVCGKSFSYSCNLDRHVKTHTGEKPYTCEICKKGFIQAVTLEAHVRTHTGETPFICTYCNKGFKQARLCRQHMKRIHLDPPVDTAVAVRRRKPAVRRTVKTENVERPFECEICGRRCATKSLLRVHRQQHGEKAYLCSECGKRFSNKVALNLHNIVHSGQKPYSCEFCQKRFAYTSSLRNHTLTHTGEKPHQCHICSKKFTQSIHLRTHLRLHDGIKPYVCTVCGKEFALKGNLTVHMRIHTGETPYVCPVCNKGFHDSSSMRKHQRGHTKK